MINVNDIASRVDRGLSTGKDAQVLLDEVRRLYGQPSPPAVLALEQAQAAQQAAEIAEQRAKDGVAAAQAEAKAAADKAASAKAVSDAMQQVAAEKAAADKAAADKALSDAQLAQRVAVGKDLVTQLEAADAQVPKQ